MQNRRPWRSEMQLGGKIKEKPSTNLSTVPLVNHGTSTSGSGSSVIE
jgi:hypothetical protein